MILKYIEECVKFVRKYYTTDIKNLSIYGIAGAEEGCWNQFPTEIV